MNNLKMALNTLKHKLTDAVNFSAKLVAPDGVVNIVLRGPSMSSDVCAVLKASNNYNAVSFLNKLSR